MNSATLYDVETQFAKVKRKPKTRVLVRNRAQENANPDATFFGSSASVGDVIPDGPYTLGLPNVNRR